jgi:hypothetical protein
VLILLGIFRKEDNKAMSTDKTLVNAAIEALIEHQGQKEDSARIIIDFAEEVLKPIASQRLTIGSAAKSDNTGVTGHTSELGDISISDDSDDSKRMVRTYGDSEKVRIGHYKVWKGTTAGLVYIQHYSKSDEGTCPDFLQRPPIFVLLYDEDTLACEGWAETDYEKRFSFPWVGFCWYRFMATVVSGERQGQRWCLYQGIFWDFS